MWINLSRHLYDHINQLVLAVKLLKQIFPVNGSKCYQVVVRAGSGLYGLNILSQWCEVFYRGQSFKTDDK